MTNTEALKRKISELGLKQTYLAEKLGLTYYGFSNKVHNKTDFKSTEIKLLCQLLNITSLKEKESIFFADRVDLLSTSQRGDGYEIS